MTMLFAFYSFQKRLLIIYFDDFKNVNENDLC